MRGEWLLVSVLLLGLMLGAAVGLSMAQSDKAEGSAAPQASSDTVATLVQVIDTSLFDPPSPDPAGLAFLDSSGTLLVSDPDVEETAHWQGYNLFEIGLTGGLLSSSTTVPFSSEPTGVAFDPTGHLFFSDRSRRRIFVVDLGSDGEYDPNDIRTYFRTEAFGSTRPEGIAFDTWDGVLFIADGLNNEVYRVDPGSNGVFDGVPATGGDDEVSQFDTESLGISEPIGIAFDPDFGHLYLVGRPGDALVQVTTSGTLMQTIDISVADIYRASGLTCAPSSQDPSVMNIYISDAGVDTQVDPLENDGKVYELHLFTVEGRVYLPLLLRSF